MTSNLYSIPDAPPIPGLRFRPFAGVSDADNLLWIHTIRTETDGIDPLSSTETIWTREDFVKSLDAMSEAGGGDRTILAEIGGHAVGYNRLFDWREQDGTHVWLNVGWVIPEWRGRGLGTALLRWSERRTRKLAAAQDKWEYAANATSAEKEATALLRDNGYTPAYTVVEMGLDWAAFRPSTALPDGIKARPGRPEDAARITQSVNESYQNEYEGGRFMEDSDPDQYAAELLQAGSDPALWRIAWDGDEIAGQVIPRIERGRAEIFEVSVRPGWRRRGLARALLSMALLELRDRGVENIRIHTVAEFPTRAVDLYLSLGFRTLKEFPRYRKSA